MADIKVASSSSTATHSSPPELRNDHSFYNKAVRKFDYALFSYTNKANQVTEAVTNPVREFIRPYHQNGSAYKAYGLADATNLSISLCSLYYTLKHAYLHSSKFFDTDEFKFSSKEMHTAEGTPEGLTWIVLFSVFLIGFSTLGSFYDENKDKPWVKNLVFLWPYARDACKQIKWWTKGWWALSGLLIQYQVAEQSFLIQLVFPLAVIGGIFSAINRIWLRWMRDSRKDMVKNNLDLVEGIKTSLHHLEKMPKSFVGYERSLIILTEMVNDTEVRSLFYINADGIKEPIIMEDNEWKDFSKQINELQTQNIHGRMKEYLNYIRKNLTVENLAIQTKMTLHFVADENELGAFDEKDNLHIAAKYFDSYIYFSQSDQDLPATNRLYYVTQEGTLLEQGENSRLFHKRYEEVQQDKNVLNLADVQLKSIIHPKIKSTAKDFGHTYAQFVDLRKNMLGEHSRIQDQHWLVRMFGPLSAGLSAVSDGVYFYLFVARMVIPTLMPGWAFFMLSASCALLVVCIITRVAQEFDFRRRLDVTILRPEAEASKKDCAYLYEQLESLMNMEDSNTPSDSLIAIATALENSREYRKNQLICHSVKTEQVEIKENLNLREKTVLLLWNELRDELMLSHALQEKLRPKLDRSYWTAGLEGLENGLAIQGAIASFSFMVSSLFYVSAATCPPAFVIGCLIAGLAAMMVSCLQGLISQYLYLKKVESTRLELSLEFRGEQLIKMTGEKGLVGDRESLKESLDYLNRQSLEPTADFIIVEWSEIFRLLFKGAVKGRNAIFEIFERLLQSTDNMWMLPIVVVAGMASFGAALGMRAAAKGFAVGRPDSAYSSGSAEKNGARKFFDSSPKLEKQKVFGSAAELQMKLLHQLDDGTSEEQVDNLGFRLTPPPIGSSYIK